MKIKELADFWIFSQKEIEKMKKLDDENDTYSIIRCNNFDDNNYLWDHLTYAESILGS